ncbi:hypothetical protein [Streptomyces sp. NPDC000618]|uniref:hypothetical protein n=1 Tax=Streptomyces sp. NPDC000618 TaxID=3154265 RepID=UPI00331F9921
MSGRRTRVRRCRAGGGDVTGGSGQVHVPDAAGDPAEQDPERLALILIERLKEPVFGFPCLPLQILEGVDAPGGGDDLEPAPIGRGEPAAFEAGFTAVCAWRRFICREQATDAALE